MERWNVGIMECWKVGILEDWNNGKLGEVICGIEKEKY